MLTLSNQHMRRIAEAYNNAFERDVLSYLSSRYPEWEAANSLDARKAQIASGAKAAEQFGLTAATNVTSFLEYRVRLGQRFEDDEQYEWASDVLRTSNINEYEKVARLKAELPLD
jgi:hypothetical protein